jgi:Ca2+-binding EF-hand superfamily protein
MRRSQLVVLVLLGASVLLFLAAARVASSANTLPKGLPAWFKDFDTDQDGQVSLAEWRKKGRHPDDFRQFDLNGDGFITPDEVLQTMGRGLPLKLEKGRASSQGVIEEAGEAEYQGRRAFKAFTVKLERGKRYQIEQVSPVYFSFLFLEGPTGQVLATHDSGGVGQTARIVHRAERTGTYRIIATSQGGFRGGPFTLTIRVLPGLSAATAKSLPSWFQELDTDHDGQISRAEWRKGGRKPEEFSRYDLNGDGFLSADEVLRATKRRSQRIIPKGLPSWFTTLDTDEDGQVSLAEWRKGGRKPEEFRLYDLNGDGLIAPEEVLHTVKRGILLKPDKGRVRFQGMVETTEEPYQGRRAYQILTVKMERGKRYQIEQVSPVYFSFLFLESPTGQVLATHDSGGFGQTARIVHRAERTGIYRIIATSQAGVRTGPYSLTGRVLPGGAGTATSLPSWFQDLDANEDGQVSLAEWRKGGRNPDEFRLYDLNGDGLIAPEEVLHTVKRGIPLRLDKGRVRFQGMVETMEEPYQGRRAYQILTIKMERGRTYQVEQVSPVYFSFLFLEDPTGQVLATHNSGFFGQTARIVHRAEWTGTHRIIATSLAGVRTGPYSLSVRVLPRSAGPMAKSVPSWFWDLDANEDGQISRDEWRKGGRKAEEFSRYDLNGDGLITPDEVVRGGKRETPLSLVKGEAKYDGVLEAIGERFFGRQVLKFFPVELVSGRTYRIEQVSQAYPSRVAVQGPDGQILVINTSPGRGQAARIVYRADRSGLFRIITTTPNDSLTGPFSLSVRVLSGLGRVAVNTLPPWFWDLDTDHDGQISRDEWRKGGRKPEEFSRYDLNGDGLITADEVQRYVQRQAKSMQKGLRRR